MNPPNNIQNGFFTPVSHFFSKIRKLTVFSRNPHTPIILQSVRLRMDADRSFVPKTRRSACSACPLQFFGNKKNHMPDAHGTCRAYDWGFGSIFPRSPRTPSTACELLPPPAGGPPPSRREVWGFRVLSKPFIHPWVQGRNPARFKGGYGVPWGFKGEKSKSPPNPLGLAERVYSFHRCGGSPPSRREVWGVRRSRPPALPSIGYRGFAVAPMTLRAPSRNVVVITVQIDGCGE